MRVRVNPRATAPKSEATCTATLWLSCCGSLLLDIFRLQDISMLRALRCASVGFSSGRTLTQAHTCPLQLPSVLHLIGPGCLNIPE